jgi:uncharacterized membrane protein YbhN (UPF0104 family)
MQKTNRPPSKVLLWSFKIILAALLIWWLWHKGGLDWKTIARVRPGWALAGLIIFQMLMILSLAWRWHLLLRGGGTPISFGAVLTITLMGQCTSTFTPGSIGIDGTRFYQLFKHLKTERATALASIVWDRILGIGALLFLTVICNLLVLTRPLPVSLKSTFIAITLFSACLLLLLLSLFWPQNPLHRLRQWRLLRDMPSTLPDKSTFMLPAVIACLTHFCNAMSLICAFYAMGEAVPIGASLLLTPVIILAGLIPLTPLGLGVSDAVALLLFHTVHIDNGANALMLGRITFVIISACCGLAWFTPLHAIIHPDSDKDEIQPQAIC